MNRRAAPTLACLVCSVVVLAGCAGPDPTTECLKWLRAACTFLQDCGQVADVDQCVETSQAGTDAEKICPSYLSSDPYCADLGDDFARCADELKSKTCTTPDATLCILYTSSQSQCPVSERVQ
jgi:hypothetical protein